MSKLAEAAGFEIYSVGYSSEAIDGLEVDDYMLDIIASNAANVFDVTTFDKLVDKIAMRNKKCDMKSAMKKATKNTKPK
jgi:hypothetical protein